MIKCLEAEKFLLSSLGHILTLLVHISGIFRFLLIFFLVVIPLFQEDYLAYLRPSDVPDLNVDQLYRPGEAAGVFSFSPFFSIYGCVSNRIAFYRHSDPHIPLASSLSIHSMDSDQ
jgi:hypothetical protein